VNAKKQLPNEQTSILPLPWLWSCQVIFRTWGDKELDQHQERMIAHTCIAYSILHLEQILLNMSTQVCRDLRSYLVVQKKAPTPFKFISKVSKCKLKFS